MIFNLYYISCTYVKPMNCMVLGNQQYNTMSVEFYNVVNLIIHAIVCFLTKRYILVLKYNAKYLAKNCFFFKSFI